MKHSLQSSKKGAWVQDGSFLRADAAMVRPRLVVRIPGLFPVSAAHWLCGLEQGLSSL